MKMCVQVIKDLRVSGGNLNPVSVSFKKNSQAFMLDEEPSGVESFNARLRDEFLDGEIFYTLKEVQVLTER